MMIRSALCLVTGMTVMGCGGDTLQDAGDPSHDAGVVVDQAASGGDLGPSPGGDPGPFPGGDLGPHPGGDLAGFDAAFSMPVGDCKTPGHTYNANEQALVALPSNTWWQAPNSKLLPLCETVQRDFQKAVEGCGSVIHSWSGGVWTGAQMLVWGGGHTAYAGNEVYGFDVPSLKWVVRSQPSMSTVFNKDPMDDGQPVSRHTYDQLAYFAHNGKMLGWGGPIALNGYNSTRTWLFSTTTNTWEDGGPIPSDLVQPYWGATAYDPVTKKVYVQDERAVRTYDGDTKTWATLPGPSYYGYKRGVISVSRRLFIAMGMVYGSSGAELFVMDLDTHADVTSQWMAITSGPPLQHDSPGADIDEATGNLVVWNGGAPWVFDFNTKQWTQLSATGAPAMPTEYGTYGRFRYLPQYNVFMLVNDENADVYFYKASANCGG